MATLPLPPAAHQTCGFSSALVVSDQGVGAVRIGASVRAVRAECQVVSDRTELGAEAIPGRVLRVRIGRSLVEAEIDNGRVWRLSFDDPRLRTSDGLAAGVPLARLLDLPGLAGAEGSLFATTPTHCGMSFQLNYEPTDQEHRGTWTSAQLAALPSKVAVTRVLVFGCSAR